MSLYSRRRTRQSLIDTVAFRALAQAATVVSYVILVRGLSKQDFGTFNLLYSFIPLLSSAASLGLEQTLRRYQPEYLRADSQAAANWLVRVVATTRLASNLVLLSLILFFWNVFAPLINLESYRVDFSIFCILIVFFFQTRILQLSLSAYMLHRYSVGSIAVISIVKLLAYGTLAWSESLNVRSAIAADLLAFACAFTFLRTIYSKKCVLPGGTRKVAIERQEKRRLLRYAVFNNFNDAGTTMLTVKTDNFFIAAIVDTVSVGIYSFYTRLNEMMLHLLPMRLFENVVQPLFFSADREKAGTNLPRYFSFLLNMNLFFQWPLLAIATAFHSEIVYAVFGGKFVEHSWILPVMGGFSTLNIVATPVTLVAQYQEKAGIVLVSKVFGIYNVIALIVMLPILGVIGAVLASGSAQAMKNLFIWWHVRDCAVWKNAWRGLLASIALWGGIVLICRGIVVVINAPPIVDLLAGAAIVAGGALIHARGPAVSNEDRELVGGVLKGREGKLLRMLGLAK